jgi:hypothetical protein
LKYVLKYFYNLDWTSCYSRNVLTFCFLFLVMWDNV